MYLANFLHFYQPPTQKEDMLIRIVKECYRPVFKGLLKIPQAKLTINLSSCLTELLDRYGFEDVIRMVGQLLKNKQIELSGSAKYHPLLPKMPEEEIVRQIKMDIETNKKYFGPAFAEATKDMGFFPPEMAFNDKVGKVVADMGFKWIIVDEYSYPGQCSWNNTYRIKNLPLGIYFRERDISFKILSAQLGTAKMLIDELGRKYQPDRYSQKSSASSQKSSAYLLTAMDGETFGHHRPGLEELLFDIYRSSKFTGVMISELADHFPQQEIVPQPSTWALMKQDQEKNIPFARWDDPDNKIHHYQWQLTDLAIKVVYGLPEDSGTRQLLDQAVHSDQYWWASAKPWWSIEYIEGGAKELLEVIKSIPNISQDVIKQAEDLYIKIVTTAFDWQRTGRVAEIAKAEDEEIRQRTDEVLPRAKKEEILKMIKNLETQMLTVTRRQEYERAAQLRDRIKELKGYLK